MQSSPNSMVKKIKSLDQGSRNLVFFVRIEYQPQKKDQRTCYGAVSANGSVSGLHGYKNPFTQNIISDMYLITPTTQYCPNPFSHVYNLYDKLAKFDHVYYCLI